MDCPIERGQGLGVGRVWLFMISYPLQRLAVFLVGLAVSAAS